MAIAAYLDAIRRAANWRASLTESANADRDNVANPDHPTAFAADVAANRALMGAT